MSRRQLQIIVNRTWALVKQIWPAFVVLATLVAFRNDWFQFWRDIRSGGGTWFWVLLGVVIVALWLAAWYVSRTPCLGEWLRRLDARFVRWGRVRCWSSCRWWWPRWSCGGSVRRRRRSCWLRISLIQPAQIWRG